MFNEILKITPKVDGAALNQMEKSLSGRFANVAKKFGSGFKSVLLGGSVTGVILTVLNKILNPLKEVQDHLEGLLDKADDLNTFATQFGSTPGKLLNLQTLAQARGVDPQELRLLLLKFQGAITDAKADTSKPSSVRNFVGIADKADAFFQFIQGMQKLNPDQRNFVEKDVFGEKLIGRSAEFLNETNFKELIQKLHLQPDSKTNEVIKSGAELHDRSQELGAGRDMFAFLTGIQKTNPGQIDAINTREKIRIKHENDQLGGFEGIIKTQVLVDKTVNHLDDVLIYVDKHLPQIVDQVEKGIKWVSNNPGALLNFLGLANRIAGSIDQTNKSRAMRGVPTKKDGN